MTKKKIQQEYKQKVYLLTKYNKHYYELSNPVVTDKEYDQLKKEIIILENKNKFLKSKNSPSINVGYKPSKSFKKVLHRIPMLSLSNAFSEKDLVNFEKRILNFLSENEEFKILFPIVPNQK